ncbi:tRNA-uridine aminocarboxypropyltransferase 2 isoform X2 [Protopterus annectens]|uniref:tRNA-uridine aminocarboxypropyltransferase 2 isoform X2 n=1 Tax=Protopterus annectens TaxID=7888 RepID=UPI001CFBEE06|nr:tRNA-uridine aminocarboxypropyltransferase 2 isoform X2 [Protopterus annectens]
MASGEEDTFYTVGLPASTSVFTVQEENTDLTSRLEENCGLLEFADLSVEAVQRRPTCSRCSRPQKVCLCSFLPVQPLNISTCLYIVQHPAEESRVLRTVPLLAACLPPDKCKVLIGRRFNETRYLELAEVCRSPNTLILYPGAEAANLEELTLDPSLASYNLIIIDGTWSQAKDMFYRNDIFRLPKQTILRPLKALCSFQLEHGAQIHHSKEHLIRNGLYEKPMPKNKRKLRRMELLVNNVKI